MDKNEKQIKEFGMLRDYNARYVIAKMCEYGSRDCDTCTSQLLYVGSDNELVIV